MKHGEKANLFMTYNQTLSNFRILRYNLTNLWRMRKTTEPPITWQEFRDRVLLAMLRQLSNQT